MDAAGDTASVLLRARNGDEGAWAEIYDELAPAVIGYLRARSAPSPEDTAGEVFVQLVRDIDRFSGDWSGFRAWTFTIANHRLIDSRRHAARRPDPEPLPDDDAALGSAPGAEGEALERIGGERVRELLAELSDDQQAVLTLRIIGGLTVEEVASAIDKRVGAVKALQRRGLRRLEKRLGGGASGVPLSTDKALR